MMQPDQLDQRIKETLCQLIYDNGGWLDRDAMQALKRAGVDHVLVEWDRPLVDISDNESKLPMMMFTGTQSLTIDSIQLTEQEYLEWVRKNKT